MFLNKTKFRKAMKEAYNGPGLKAGRIYGGLVLCSGTWILWVKEGAEPNWLKGALMELAGELPEEESMFQAAHNEAIQYEIKENSIYDLPREFCNSHYAFKDTGISMEGRHFLQGKEDKRTVVVPDMYRDMIDLRELQGENPPIGPVSRSLNGDILIYKNENSAFAFCRISTSDKRTLEVMNILQEIDFFERG